MSDEKKIYINGLSIKQHTFASGKTILKVGIRVDTLIEQLKAHVNERGYVNLGISARKSAGKYGETHCAWVDTWQPSLVNPASESSKVGGEALPF